ncbi:hypothetical protein [Streptomyces sp. NPDC053048]|uniref:hypothetical protein n=1 Tax=Streptomyces sp. NPDC053048 TaxID=3365694 RepID=UPI0037D926F1
MTVRAAWLLTGPPAGQTRTDTRLAPVGTYAPEGELTTREGVLAGGSPLVATGVGPMKVQLGIGRALVQGTNAQGAYPVAVTAPETLTVTDGNPQYSRLDSLVLRVYDGLFDATGKNEVAVELISGDPAPTPVEPTLPASCLRLWTITVPAGASAGTGGIPWQIALADRRRYTSAYGGIIPRGWGSTFTGAYDGQYRDNNGALERWSATANSWQPYPFDSGWQTLTLATGYMQPAGHGMPAAWRRIGPMIMLRGRIGPTKAGTTIPNGQTIFTLPAAARPAGGREFAWSSPRDQVGTGPSVCRVEIQPTGNVRTYEFWSPPQWISLDGVTYTAD